MSASRIFAEDQVSLDRNLAIARDLGATIHVLDGKDPVQTLVDFAKSNGVTQIVPYDVFWTGIEPASSRFHEML